MGPVPIQHRDALGFANQLQLLGDHRANHTIPPFWLDDRPPLLRHVNVRPAAGWSVLALQGGLFNWNKPGKIIKYRAKLRLDRQTVYRLSYAGGLSAVKLRPTIDFFLVGYLTTLYQLLGYLASMRVVDSEMVFGKIRPRIRHRLPDIHLTVRKNLGKTQSVDEPPDVSGRYVANVVVGILSENCVGKKIMLTSEKLEKMSSVTGTAHILGRSSGLRQKWKCRWRLGESPYLRYGDLQINIGYSRTQYRELRTDDVSFTLSPHVIDQRRRLNTTKRRRGVYKDSIRMDTVAEDGTKAVNHVLTGIRFEGLQQSF
ncbi:hypothetical protein ANN_16308 [Periplaneta americana]|uniref:Uncharacterized protein n=1 Tax=Periplaneta americana TaxID=6978 RepID=A0ABQ8SIL3_PERAM|nr:hypothetical protein ANN_16308 [Periplaneta americana]